MKTVDPKKFPILARLLAAGSIVVENGWQYVGLSGVPSILAPDGKVGVGAVGNEKGVEEYLTRFPNPSQW